LKPEHDRKLREEAERRLGGASDEVAVARVELELQYEELQRAHRELSSSHDRYRDLFEQGPVSMLEIDDIGRIARMNVSARELFSDVVGLPLTTIAAEGEANELLSTLAQSKTRQPVQRDLELRGVTRRVTARVAIHVLADDLTLVAIEDVTELRRVNAELAAERQLRQVLERNPDGMAVVRDGELVFGNAALARMLGLTERDLVGKTLSSFVEDTGAVTSPTGRDVRNAELRVETPEGIERTVECHSLRIDFRGEPARLLTMRDITDRRRIEARMARAERLATVGMLVAGVAHEVNNPLTYVMANLQLATRQVADDSETYELLTDALEGAERISQITRDLKTFHEADEAHHAVNINDVVRDALRMARSGLAGRARVVHDPGAIPETVANPGRLVQVVLNLVINAGKAMPERPTKENVISVRTWATDDDVCILVGDNGVGITDDAIGHIFDPFFTTRREVGGTGLGLSICNSIVQQLGGFIDVESKVGVGTRFVVHIPVQPAAIPKDRSAHTSRFRLRKREGTKRLRLLIVEDDASVQRSLRRHLKSLGEVDLDASGNQAMRRLAEDDAYDVILSDLVMSDGTGMELARWIEAEKPQLMPRLVFMSGMPHPRENEPDDVPCLRKPFDMDELHRRLSEVARAADGDASEEMG